MSVINNVLRDLQHKEKKQGFHFWKLADKSYFPASTMFFTVLASCFFVYLLFSSNKIVAPDDVRTKSSSEISIFSLFEPVGHYFASLPDTQPAQHVHLSEINSQTNETPQIIPTQKNPRELLPEKADKRQPVSPSNSFVSNPTSDKNSEKANGIQVSKQTLLADKLNQIQSNYFLVGYQKTKQQLLALLSKHPDFHNARAYYLSILIENNDDAETALQLTMDQYANISPYRLIATTYYFNISNFTRANELLQDINSQSANLVQLLQMRAIVRQKLNLHSQAVQDYQYLITNYDGRGEWYLGLAISLESLGQTEQAKLGYQSALQDQMLSAQQKQFISHKIKSW
ncbi:MAG: hypothetical protein OEY19_03455 [Gammaproteobacteria bacterium]|nr:hypothetical protein [Gammaproteobacteria bacterium]